MLYCNVCVLVWGGKLREELYSYISYIYMTGENNVFSEVFVCVGFILRKT